MKTACNLIRMFREGSAGAGVAAAAFAFAFALSPAVAVPFFKGYGTDGMRAGEHGVGAFYQHQKSAQGPNFVDPMTNQVSPPRPFNSDPWPTPLAPGYNQTWDHDSNPLTPEKSRNWWEGAAGGGSFTGGWCGTTAWINSLHFFDQNGYSGLIDHSNLDPAVGPPFHGGRNWLERFTYANEDLALRAGGGASGGCAAYPRAREGTDLAPGSLIPDYLADYGYGGKFVYDEFFWDTTRMAVMQRTAGGDVGTAFTSILDLYRTELLRSEDVLLIMEGASKEWWWSRSFHVVTGAGVETDPSMNKLWFADPDKGRGGINGWGKSFLETDPVPEGIPFYTMASLKADGRTFDSGPYSGAAITEVRTLSPRRIPEPATVLLLAVGLAALVLIRHCAGASPSGHGGSPYGRECCLAASFLGDTP